MLHLLKNFFSVGKKIFLVFIVFFLIINLFLYFISKDKTTQTYDPIKSNRDKIYKTINDPELNKTKEGKITIAIYKSMTCSWIGEACTDNPNDGDKNFSKSLSGTAANLITMTYTNPPASGVYWAKSSLQSAGFISNAYAAEGFGFAGIKPLRNIWKIFRDLAYMLIVLIIVIIGFMIMFRMKLNPQTVISAETALPKIVISLLLITFSFAIAGFLIDLMYVVISVILSLLSGNGTHFNAAEYQNKYLTGGPNQIFPSIFPAGFDTLMSVGDSFLNILPVTLSVTIRTLAGGLALFFTAQVMSLLQHILDMFKDIGALTFNIGGLGSGLISLVLIPVIFTLAFAIGPQLIVAILFFFTLLFLFFRIFFLLLKAYIQILILIIFAPIILLGAALPGKNAFGYWFKNLLAEILTFPLVITILVLGSIITKELAAPGKLWTPPLLYTPDTTAFTVLVGVGMLLIIPDLNKLMKELLGVKGMPVGLNFGAFFGGISAPVSGGMGIAGQFGSLYYAKTMAKSIPFLKNLPGIKEGGGGGNKSAEDALNNYPRG